MVIEKILSDGLVVGRRALVLNINRNRRYYIAVDGRKYCDNLLYSELLRWLPIVRQAMEKEVATVEKRIDSSLNTIDLDLALFIMEEDDHYAVADGRIVFIAEE